MNYKTVFTAILATLAFTAISALADDAMDASKLPPVAATNGVTYAKDIKPIFEASCVKCHHGERPKGKYALDTLENALKPGKDAQDIVVGKSDKSPLVYAVAHVGDEDDFMPKGGRGQKAVPLTKDQVSLIRAWIDQGAK